MQSRQVSDDGQAVCAGVSSVAARVLRQPQDLQTAQTLQMPEFGQTLNVVASQIELAEMLTGRDVLQRGDVIGTESTETDADTDI